MLRHVISKTHWNSVKLVPSIILFNKTVIMTMEIEGVGNYELVINHNITCLNHWFIQMSYSVRNLYLAVNHMVNKGIDVKKHACQNNDYNSMLRSMMIIYEYRHLASVLSLRHTRVSVCPVVAKIGRVSCGFWELNEAEWCIHAPVNWPSLAQRMTCRPDGDYDKFLLLRH